MERPVKSEIDRTKLEDPDKTFKIWVLSDIQPASRKQRREFEEAIEDINQNVPDISIALVAGDIVNDSEEEDFDWYKAVRTSSYIKDWYEVAGNHDLKLDRGNGYKRKLREGFYYSFQKGNILFLMMSDELRGKATDISDETFEWWKSMVEKNQDKIIVVVTHAPLEGSGIPFSGHPDRQIKDSHRFEVVLKKYKVDLWFSGHLHIPHSLAGNIEKRNEYNGTVFVNISSIRSELLGLKQSESRIVTFICGSDQVLIRSRNHNRREFDSELDAVFRLSEKFECGDKKEVTSGRLRVDG